MKAKKKTDWEVSSAHLRRWRTNFDKRPFKLARTLYCFLLLPLKRFFFSITRLTGRLKERGGVVGEILSSRYFFFSWPLIVDHTLLFSFSTNWSSSSFQPMSWAKERIFYCFLFGLCASFKKVFFFPKIVCSFSFFPTLFFFFSSVDYSLMNTPGKQGRKCIIGLLNN